MRKHSLAVAASCLVLACGADTTVARHHPGPTEGGLFAGSVPGAATTCASVPLDLSGPRPGVTLTMADGNSYPAIIDTGAMDTTINVAFAPLLGLANEGPLAPPFGRHATGYQSTLRGARLGSLALPDRSVAVMASPLADAAAIISPAAFMGKLVRLDMGQGVLQVCPKTDAHLPRTAPFAYSPPPFALPSFPLTIDGRTFQAHLDTGSGNQLIFPTALAQQLEIEGEWRQVGTARLHAGPARPIYRAKLKGDARIGPVTIRQPEVASLEIIPQVNIGMGILRGLVVTIDPAERRSWVERGVP